MQVGDTTVEFVWPGLLDGFPGIALLIIMPLILIYGYFRFTNLSLLKKVCLIPLALIGPMLMSSLWPLALSLSGFLRVASAHEQRRVNWTEASNIFGHHSIYVWTVLTFIAVLTVFQKLRLNHLHRLGYTSKQE